jgi:four helix bundle protein
VGDVLGVRKPEELDAWRLAWELKERVFAFTATGSAFFDLKFREQIRDAAQSVCDNICEGFYRFAPKDFARFLNIARGSLGEVQNQLRHARSCGYLGEGEYRELILLSSRALGASTRLHSYLRSLPKNFVPGSPNPEP